MGDQKARTAGRTTSLGPPDQRNDRWLTPLPIIEALTTGVGRPAFDLDPCGAPGHDTATRKFLLENGEDGLRDDWIIPWSERTPGRPLGAVPRAWINPPYGREKIKWVQRFLDYYEAGQITGTILIPFNPGEVGVWIERCWPKSSAILAYRHRINFWSRDPKKVGNDPSGKTMVSVNDSALVAFGQEDADALWEAVSNDLIPGFLTDYTGTAR